MPTYKKVLPLVFDCAGGLREINETIEAVPTSLTLNGISLDLNGAQDGYLLAIDLTNQTIKTRPVPGTDAETLRGLSPSDSPDASQIVVTDNNGWIKATHFHIRVIDLSTTTQPIELKPYERAFLRFDGQQVQSIPIILTQYAVYRGTIARWNVPSDPNDVNEYVAYMGFAGQTTFNISTRAVLYNTTTQTPATIHDERVIDKIQFGLEDGMNTFEICVGPTFTTINMIGGSFNINLSQIRHTFFKVSPSPTAISNIQTMTSLTGMFTIERVV